MTAPVFPSVDPADIYDLIGIGLGPTHVALAVAFKEDHPDGRALFLDQRPAFAWHPALLLPASRMQISFLKDLAVRLAVSHRCSSSILITADSPPSRSYLYSTSADIP